MCYNGPNNVPGVLMADWASEIEVALSGPASGPAGGVWLPGRGTAAAPALAAAHDRATSHLLAQGIVLTTLLGRCALAEAEEDDAYLEYRRELAAAAVSLVADWQALLAVCRRAGVAAEQVVGKGKAACMTRSVIHLAQEIVGQTGTLGA
jgi:hypothetical protein